MPRTARRRAPEPLPTVPVPEILCISAEEVSDRFQATAKWFYLWTNRDVKRIKGISATLQIGVTWWNDSFTGTSVHGRSEGFVWFYALPLNSVYVSYWYFHFWTDGRIKKYRCGYFRRNQLRKRPRGCRGLSSDFHYPNLPEAKMQN